MRPLKLYTSVHCAAFLHVSSTLILSLGAHIRTFVFFNLRGSTLTYSPWNSKARTKLDVSGSHLNLRHLCIIG